MSTDVHSTDRITTMSQKERDVLKVLHGVVQGERTQAEAARLFGFTTRHVRRLQRRRNHYRYHSRSEGRPNLFPHPVRVADPHPHWETPGFPGIAGEGRGRLQIPQQSRRESDSSPALVRFCAPTLQRRAYLCRADAKEPAVVRGHLISRYHSPGESGNVPRASFGPQ